MHNEYVNLTTCLQCPPQANRGGTCSTSRCPSPCLCLGRCWHTLQRVRAPGTATVGALAAPSTAQQAAHEFVPASASACSTSAAHSSR